MSSENPDGDPMQQWRADVELRAAGGKRPIKRGRGSRAAAPGTWTAEGRLQCAGQLDIWACIAEAEHAPTADEFDDPAA